MAGAQCDEYISCGPDEVCTHTRDLCREGPRWGKDWHDGTAASGCCVFECRSAARLYEDSLGRFGLSDGCATAHLLDVAQVYDGVEVVYFAALNASTPGPPISHCGDARTSKGKIIGTAEQNFQSIPNPGVWFRLANFRAGTWLTLSTCSGSRGALDTDLKVFMLGSGETCRAGVLEQIGCNGDAMTQTNPKDTNCQVTGAYICPPAAKHRIAPFA